MKSHAHGNFIDFKDARGVVIERMVKEAPDDEREELAKVLEPLRYRDINLNVPPLDECTDAQF
ncbi:hypothetical protein N9Z02_00755 [Akkermansiaceae bacterium]|nr:hypothetical protein [Akkermansiaceae bacterium]